MVGLSTLTDVPKPLSDALLESLSTSTTAYAPQQVSPVFVDSVVDQQKLDAKLQSAGILGVDTEFIRETTFHPALALVQLALPDEAVQYVVDVPTLDQAQALDVFKQQLLSPSTIKVMHGCSEDIEIFMQFCDGVPANVFDTQIAAALLGERAQIGYDGLVAGLFSDVIDKSATRSDWLQRPLSAEQIKYAAADVTYLLPLYERLSAALEAKGRASWLADEYAQLAYSLSHSIPVASLYQRIGLHWRLRGLPLYVLQQLCIWREEQVRARNIPRSFLLNDAALLAVAKLSHPSATQIKRLEDVKPGQWRRYGDDIMAAVKNILENAPPKAGEDLPVIMPKPKKYRALVKQLKAVVSERAQILGLEPNVLLGKRYLHQFLELAERQARQTGAVDLAQLQGAPWLQGWRSREVLPHLVAPLLTWLKSPA